MNADEPPGSPAPTMDPHTENSTPSRKRSLEDDSPGADDPNFSPSQDEELKRANADDKTPKKRKVTRSDTSETQKRKARDRQLEVMRLPKLQKNDFYGPVPCLISRRRLVVDSIQVCHVLANGTPAAVIRRLEYSWGMENETLHVDTRDNMIMLTEQLHAAYDGGAFILLPEASFVTRMMRAEDRCDVEVQFRENLYTYQFVPLPKIKGFSFSVYLGTHDYLEPRGDEVYEAHVYPFDQLPPINSHCKPHFAVFNTGKKLFDTFGPTLKKLFVNTSFDIWIKDAQLTRLTPTLRDCHALYKRWISTDTPTIFQALSRRPGTQHRRISRSMFAGPPNATRQAGTRSSERLRSSKSQQGGQSKGTMECSSAPAGLCMDDNLEAETESTYESDGEDWRSRVQSWVQTVDWQDGARSDSSEDLDTPIKGDCSELDIHRKLDIDLSNLSSHFQSFDRPLPCFPERVY